MKPGNADEVKLLKIARKADSVCKQLSAMPKGGFTLDYMEYLMEEYLGLFIVVAGMQVTEELLEDEAVHE